MPEYTIDSKDGSQILVTDEYGGWAWVGCAGIFGEDDLNDIRRTISDAAFIEAQIEDDD